MVRGRSSRLAQWTFNFNEHDKQSLSDDALAGMRRSGGTNRAPCVDVVSNLVAHRRESWQADHANAATTWKAGKSRGVPFLVALLLLAGCIPSERMTPQEMANEVAKCELVGLRAVYLPVTRRIECRPHREDCLHD
jgi:hypothetical protein